MGRIQYRVANGSSPASTSYFEPNATTTTACHTHGHLNPASASSYFTNGYLTPKNAASMSQTAVQQGEPFRLSLSDWDDDASSLLLRQKPRGHAARKVGQKIPGLETGAGM